MSPSPSPDAPASFADLGVKPEIVSALSAVGISSAFPIQQQCIPLALKGSDLIGQAKTGTGKTLGFGIPLLQRILFDSDGERIEATSTPRALVVVPTRELCLQVANDLQVAGSAAGVRVLAIFGGRAYEPQLEAIKAGLDVVVGTPGRLLDLARSRYLDLSAVEVLVLDEADEMLDMGFLPDVESIIELIPSSRQTMLFSATMPSRIVSLSRRYMSHATHVRADDPGDDRATVDAIEQHVWRAHPLDKPEVVARILQSDGRGLSIIFCRTKRSASRLAEDLEQRGFSVSAIHGDLGQDARERSLKRFREHTTDVLVATDVAARGIDITGVTHVINYVCPEDEKTYLHRVGRTGRAGASGVAVTLVDWEDTARWAMINKALGLAFNEPIETYSTSEHIFTGLGIPREAKGWVGAEPPKPAPKSGGSSSGSRDSGRSNRSTSNRSTKGKDKSSHKNSGRSASRSTSDGSRGQQSTTPASDNAGSKPSRKRQRTRKKRSDSD